MNNWKQTTRSGGNLKIFREEFEEFLPGRVLDFHVHVCPAAARNPGAGYAFDAGGNKLPEYTIDELKNDLDALYPGRENYGVCFGMPLDRVDRRKNNEYAASACDRKHFFPLMLVSPEDDPDDVEEDIVHGKFLGYKPYQDYVKGKPAEAVEIADMLPDRLMRIADRHGLIVLLHIPRRERFADKVNLAQISFLCENYPNAKIVLAHVGRAYYLKNITGSLEMVMDYPNIHFDLAMLNNAEVLEYLFRRVKSEKILYATDIPIALAAGKSVEINDQYSYVTPIPWDLSISDDRGGIVFTSFAYEEIRAIKKAVMRLGLSRAFVEGIFFNNGWKLLGEVEP